MKAIKSRKGFTLIELLAVIVILAVIMVVTIPSVLNSMNGAKSEQLQNATKVLSDWLTKQYNLSKLDDNFLGVDPIYNNFINEYGDYENSYASAKNNNKSLSICSNESYEVLSVSGISNPEDNIDIENSYVWKGDNKIEVKLSAKEGGAFYVNGGTNISYSNTDITLFSEFKIYGNSIQNGTPSPSNPVEIKSVGDKTVNVMPSAEKSIKQQNGVTIECDGLGTYTITGKASSDTTIDFDLKSSFTIPLSKGSGGKGTMSIFNSSSSSAVYIYFKNDSTDIDYWFLNQKNKTSYSYSRQGNKICNKIGIKVTAGENINMTLSPVFTNNSVYPSEPIPYGYKIPITVSDGTNSSTTNIYLDEPLRKIGDYADYIDFKNSKIKRYFKEIEITGGFELYNQSNQLFFTKTISGMAGGSSVTSNINISKLNKFIYNDYIWNHRDTPQYGYVTRYTTLNIRNLDYATASEFNNWLESNPLKFVYRMSTPTEETITLPSISSINETTTCQVNTEVQPSNIVIEY